LGKLGKDAKDLIIGNDGSTKEPNDFKSELQEAIKNGVVSKSDGTLLITSRMNVDKLGEKIEKEQEKGVVAILKDGKSFDTPEEEMQYRKEKEEEERKKKEKEAQVSKQMQEQLKKKKNQGGGQSKRKNNELEEKENLSIEEKQ